jgi:hypothetical protein
LILATSMDPSGAGFAANPLGKPAPQTRRTAELEPAKGSGVCGPAGGARRRREPEKKQREGIWSSSDSPRSGERGSGTAAPPSSRASWCRRPTRRRRIWCSSSCLFASLLPFRHPVPQLHQQEQQGTCGTGSGDGVRV